MSVTQNKRLFEVLKTAGILTLDDARDVFFGSTHVGVYRDYYGCTFKEDILCIMEAYPGLDQLYSAPTYRYSPTVLLDFMYYQLPDKQPQVFFANGNVRKTYISNLVLRQQQGKAKWPETKRRVLELKQNWEKLDQETKNILISKSFFTPTGELEQDLVSALVLDGHGVRSKEVNLNFYEKSKLYSLIYGDNVYYRKKDSQQTEEIAFNNRSYEVTEEELAWFKTKYTKCTACGAWEVKDSVVFGLCTRCNTAPRELRGYSERATDFFSPFIKEKGKYSSRLSGVELEYELNEGKSQREALFFLHRNLKDHAIFKRDGSLDNGIEICTRPASIDIQTTEFRKMFEDTACMDTLVVEKTCGMHVHVEKKKLSSLTLGKLTLFMQAKKNKEFLETIAERQSNSYTRTGTDLSVTSVHRGVASGDRYQALNLTNQNTIEFRIFKTPEEYGSFLKNMEFIDAITTFAMPATSGIQDVHYESFLNFVKNNRKTYTELYSFTKERF